MPPDLSVDSIDAQRVSDRALSNAAPANESPSSANNPALAGVARGRCTLLCPPAVRVSASAKVLRAHRANQAAEALALRPAWVDSGLVFTSTAGPVIEPRNLNRSFDELITKAGVRRIRFQYLRHTCASLLLAQNAPARVVMEILGHSQLAMTTDLYSHVTPTALREAADAMDRVFVQPN
jgi:integrase